MKKIFLAMLVAVLSITAHAQQSAQFSQYMFNELYINPAYAGYKESLYAHLLYRTQWVGMEGAPKTFMLGADGTVSDKLNFGLQVYSDRIGLLSTTSVMATYAYRVRLTEEYSIRFGLSLGGLYSGLDGSKIVTTGSVNPDPLIANGSYSHLSPDAAVGVYFYSDLFYAGLSALNLMAGKVGAPTREDYKLPQQDVHMFFTVGGLVYLSRDVKLKPSMLYKEDFKSPSGFDINAMFLLFEDRLWLGASYRTEATLWKASTFNAQGVSSFEGNSLAIMAELFITNRIRLGYAYDYSFSAVSNCKNTHEVSLGFYLMPNVTKVYSPRFY